MFSIIGGIFRLFGLLLLSVLLASCGGGGGGDDGGFTPERIDVAISADKTSLSANLTGEGPNPARPYTSTITAQVTKSGRLFPSTITVTRTAGDREQGVLFKIDDLTQGFQRIVLENTDGIGQVYFLAGTGSGKATITASATDPSTNQTISKSVEITVVAEERPAKTITFTGPYVNAVLAGQSRFGDPPLQNGAYSRALSVVVNDANGNPANPNTKINFFLVDAPLTGYPANPGAFYIAGSDGDPVEGGYQFSAASGDFQRKGVQVFNRLVLDGRTTLSPTPDNRFETGIWQVQDVLSATSLTIRQEGPPFNTSVNGLSNGATVPYLIGYTENGAVLSPAFTDINGVANTLLTYPANRIGQTAVLVACAEDDAGEIITCGILNTCAANGTNCKSVYLDVTNGSDRTLTVSTTSLGPNRRTDVQMCLRDAKSTPLPATEIRYNIGSAGPATVTVNGVAGNAGAFFTGGDGCAVVPIASSGQIPGSQPITLQFTSDFVAAPATITIKSPGAGKMDGLFNCEFDFEKATAKCAGTLRLTDDEGTPMPGILIAVGNVTAAGLFKLTFNPAEGIFGKTDDQGQVQATVELDGPGDYVFPFQTASGGTAKYELKVTVPAPGTLKVSLVGETKADIGKPYSATLQAEGGVPPYAWSLLSGSLPPGLSLSANGTISGTPTTAGSFSFAVQVTDSKKRTGFGAFTITVGQQAALTVILSPLTGVVNVPFNGVASATGGTAPYRFSLLAGSLPTGLTLSANGTVSGTPTQTGAFAFSIQATDNLGATGTGNFTITITSATPLTVKLEGPATGTVGAAYSGVLTATGGTAPYTFAITAGSLPDGVGLNINTGALSGTPTKAGTFVFTAQATDSKGAKGTATVTLTINTPNAPTIATESPLPNATPGTFYTTIFTATGGTPPYQWTFDVGSRPASLTLNANTGALSGTPTTAEVGTYNFIIRVTDANGAFALKTFTLVVGSGGGGGGATVGNVVVLANPGQLESSGQIPVNLTAVVRDVNNVLLKDVTVTFTADNNGTLQVTRAVTDDTGTATAILTTPGDKSNRNITVVATAGGFQGSVVIPVVGTTITSTGPSTAVIGSTVDITFTLKDSAGAGIAGQTLTVISEPAGNIIVPTNPVTNAAGQATVKVTANVSGSIVASALGAIGSHALSVATDNFVFIDPDPNAAPVDVCLGPPTVNCAPPKVTPPKTLRVRLTSGNPPVGVAGKTVTFETTRGTPSATSAVTNAAGEASLTITSDNAGPALITAKTTDTSDNPIQTQVQINFVATTPTQMTLQANPGTVSVNVPPSTDQKSTITATVRDAEFNLVKGVTVTFVLTDVTGGAISPASAVTDEFGQASTVYTAGTAASALNGVRVDAAVTGFAVTASVTLTVAQRSLFITLGTGNEIVEPNPTTYEYPYSVLVTDTAGLPVQNALITLNVVPVAASTGLTAYFKGRYNLFPDATPPWQQQVTASCVNEDLNQNGILDSGEDVNGNGRLEPGNVVTVSATSLTTNASGFAFFNVVYAQQYANWVRVELSARASVAGSEATEIARFVLPILAADLSSKDVSPPGNPSPFGAAASCADPN